MKVAVIGASGFVGATLVERLLSTQGREVAPFIHTSGNAGRIARLGIPLRTVNLLDHAAVAEAVKGCTHVVNCSRGGDAVMIKGLRNLLEACRRAGVMRFVHLSSVMVYGDPPSPDSDTEDGRTEPQPGTYGWVKLEQDKLVAAAAAEGLSGITLCPPNISGAQSGYPDMIVNALRCGQLALLDEGRTPCNLVDVCNLAHAIELALDHGPCDGRRLFVTDDHPATWRDVIDELQSLVGPDVALPAIDRDELTRLALPPRPRRVSLGRSLLHLASSDVREALRKDPLWAGVDASLRNSVRFLGSAVEDRLRLALERRAHVPPAARTTALNVRLCAQQLRGITHSCGRAKQLLGYRPVYSFGQSMAAFRRWYRCLHGWDTPVGELLQAL